MRSDSPVGQMMLRFGPDPVPANPSAAQESGKAQQTHVTCGPYGLVRSQSASLQWSLESRLLALMGSRGSILYRLTWSRLATPSRRLICALQASARRISVNASSLQRCGWATPIASDCKAGYRPPGRAQGDKLSAQVTWITSGWGTPCARDQRTINSSRALQKTAGHKGVSGFQHLFLQASLVTSGWPTTVAADANSGGTKLQKAVKCAGWTSPMASDANGGGLPRKKLENMRLSGQVKLSGSGCTSETGRSGPLNPEFTSWLMGYPPEWLSCAP